MPKVEFNDENVKKCRCPDCPVQIKSECFKRMMEKIKEIQAKPGQTPLLYCSQGKSMCNDLDGNQSCICPTCPVWSEHGLSSMYYCLRGSADEIE